MTVKEYLGRAIKLDELIQSHVEELGRYRRLAEGGGGMMLGERVDHSRTNDAPYAKWVERIVDKERDINKEIDRLVALKLEISDFIDGVDDIEWQCLLRSRYVMCKPWQEVADEMHCSMRTIQRMHKKILESLKVDT